MEDGRRLALNSEVYFLIQRFLSGGILKKTLKVFNEELEECKIFPKRIDWEGREHDRTVNDMIEQFQNIRPDFLLHLCYEASKSTAKNNLVTSFLSFKSKSTTNNGIPSNFTQIFNFLTRYHGAPIHPIHTSFNMINSLRGREVSGRCSRHRTVTPKLYSNFQIHRTTLGHLSAVYCLLFDHSGRYIITGADDLLIKLWSTHTGCLIYSFRGASSEITDIAINSENTLMAAGSIDRILRVWNMQTGAPVAVLTGHTGMITSVNFCPTPSWGIRYLITTSTDSSVAFWTYSYESGTKTEFRNAPILYQEKVRPGQSQMICSSFSPGGTFLATGSADHHVRVYYMRGDEGPHRILEMEAHSDRVDSIQWAHSGLRFLSGSKDGMAIIWWFERQQWKSIHLDMTTRLPTAQNVSETDVKKLKVTMVCWNKSDQWVVTAVSDYTLKIWTAANGQLEKVLTGHKDQIYVLESHPHDNNIILSAGHDGQLFIWDILKGEIIYSFLNTVEGQGYGAIFDAKWSPDGCVISASDSHGHILTFGFGNGSPFYEKLPRELFFHTDYRPLVSDTNHWVLDEQTQIPPHLMPPPFLVDIDGNPYPPMLQRLVPGRELCNVEQLVPNIIIGNEGAQEVIQEVHQNHDMELEHNEEDEELRGPGSAFRSGRRNTERIRQSTGEWQRDPNMEWKKNILVQPLRKSMLERASEIRERTKDMEMEEYQKQLRQRPHMISINTSNNIKKREEKKKKDAKYPKRIPKTKYAYKDDPEDEPESSGNNSESSRYSDWMEEEQPKRSRRRQAVTNHVSSSDQDDEDDDDDDDEDDEDSYTDDSERASTEPQTSRGKGKMNGRNKERKRRNARFKNKEKENHFNHVKRKSRSKVNGFGENHLGESSKKNNILNYTNSAINKIANQFFSQLNNASTSGNISRQSKFKLAEQYRLSEWLSETKPRKSPYYPQLGDELVYFIEGHQLYLNAVQMKKLYEVKPEELPWSSMEIRDHEFVKVIEIQYEIRPPRLCCLKLAITDEDGQPTSKVFTIKYHDIPDVLDFFVLKQLYHTALSRDWQPSNKFRCMIDDEWWIGHIINKVPASDVFPDSSFLCYEIGWGNGEQERMSPWDMEPVDPERMPEDENQSIPVLDHELSSILYKTVEGDWPSEDKEAITRNIVAGLTKVMELAIAEPFLVPVDLNVYPTYALVIEYPIDLSTIKARFENNFYRRLTAAQFDIRYLATNAEKFNEKHSIIVKYARIITQLCLRIVENCVDYVDVPSLYRQFSDNYESAGSEQEEEEEEEEEIEIAPSTSRGLRTLSSKALKDADDWTIEAERLIDALWKCEDSIPFRAPVNRLKYPDYHLVVKNPMDLGTIKENLKNGKYNVPQEFCIDVRLIFQNSRLYNTNKKSRIYVMTMRLSALFEKHIDKLIHNWKIAKRRQNRKRDVAESNSDVSITSPSSATSDEDVKPEHLMSQSQEDDDSNEEDDVPLTVLRSRQNTESDSTIRSHDTITKVRIKIRKNTVVSNSEDEYSVGTSNNRKRKKIHVQSTSEEEEEAKFTSENEDSEEEFVAEEDDEEEGEEEEQRVNHGKSLRQRPIKRKIFVCESSDSDSNSNGRKRKLMNRSESSSDSDSDDSRTKVWNNNDKGFMSSVSSRGRVRKITERAKALFEKR